MSVTVKLSPGALADLRRALNDAERFEFRRLDHAHFQARGDDVVVSAYKSGKVVVQGKGTAGFLEAFGLDAPAPKAAPAALTDVVAGSDESGKGDYFGPLVVAAVVVKPDQAAALARAGVQDSKRMGEHGVFRAAKAIRDLCPHAVRALSPQEYNARHEAEGNVALFLATMHAEALADAIAAAGGCDRVVIDQFTRSERLQDALDAAGVGQPLEARPRAEDNPAVAAASVLARAEFLLGLRELGHPLGRDLPKGAGTPVDRAAREIFAEGGLAALAEIAKLHFRTTQKVTERLF